MSVILPDNGLTSKPLIVQSVTYRIRNRNMHKKQTHACTTYGVNIEYKKQ